MLWKRVEHIKFYLTCTFFLCVFSGSFRPFFLISVRFHLLSTRFAALFSIRDFIRSRHLIPELLFPNEHRIASPNDPFALIFTHRRRAT